MNEKPTAGQVFGALGKALCALLLFLGCQILVSLGYTLTFAIYNALTGVGDVIEMIFEYTGQISLISDGLVLVILLIFFLIRKKNPFTSVSIRPCDGKMVLLGIGLAPILYALVNLFFAILPEAWLEGYVEASSALDGTGPILALATVILAPVTEEVIFRGYMLSRLNRALPGWVCVLVTAALFGVCHGQFIWMLYAFLLGLVFGLIALRCRSILPTIAAHLVFNAIGHFSGYLPEDTNVFLFSLILILVGLVICLCVRKTAAQILFQKGMNANGTDSQ